MVFFGLGRRVTRTRETRQSIQSGFPTIQPSTKDPQQSLGVLEEDEFEEFAAAGALNFIPLPPFRSPSLSSCFSRLTTVFYFFRPMTVLNERTSELTFPLCPLDWDDSETDLAHLGGAASGAAKSSGDKLWEDKWDDDDIEGDLVCS
jgi:hypothetical protein